MSTTRRNLVAGAGAVGLVGVGAAAIHGCSIRPKRELRWLGWEHYDVPALKKQFEEEFDCTLSAQYFDGNSEAYTKLKSGGKDDIHVVMADGFWPRLYLKDGLTQPINLERIQGMKEVFPAFRPPNYPYLQAENDPKVTVAVPNCWGGYGLTVNVSDPSMKNRPKAELESLNLLFDPKLAKRITTSARFEENIALTGILVAHEQGAIKPGEFNPYDLSSAQLDACEAKLREQAKLLVARWHDEDTLERLLRSQEVLVSPEWSGIYRRIHFDALAKKKVPALTHVLVPTEGGLGWVDTWGITSGTKDPEMLKLAEDWISFRLRPSSMEIMATQVGWAPCVDIRKNLHALPDGKGQPYIDTLFLDKTESIGQLYQFDKPSDPARWERVWANVLKS